LVAALGTDSAFGGHQGLLFPAKESGRLTLTINALIAMFSIAKSTIALPLLAGVISFASLQTSADAAAVRTGFTGNTLPEMTMARRAPWLSRFPSTSLETISPAFS
jgi:hypothetical protein